MSGPGEASPGADDAAPRDGGAMGRDGYGGDPVPPTAGTFGPRGDASVDPLQDDPAVVAALGPGYATVRRFADLLTSQGPVRGLIGPREVPRLWERHLLNSAALAPLLPVGRVVDVGSGAGLPGVVLAALRPDVQMVLVEPMERRVRWLTEVVAALGLSTEVVRARAEELHGRLLVDAVTARAVAPLDRLAGWTVPLLRTGGVLLALKGDRAVDELAAAGRLLGTLGADEGEVVDVRVADGLPGTSVVRVTRVAAAVPQHPGLSGRRQRHPGERPDRRWRGRASR